MPWAEFTTLISGLMPDTPLGAIVKIRAETNSDAIKNFTSDQRRIYQEWQNKQLKKQLENPEALDEMMDKVCKQIEQYFGKSGG
jgi:DNA-binding SARP family transcriptional activator